MAILIGGIVAIVLGVILGVVWYVQVFSLVGGGLPVLLLLGGGIAIYLGIDELRYPAAKAYPAPEREKEGPLEGAPEPSAAAMKGIRYWLLGYSAGNVELVREKGMIALPAERSEIIEKMMNIGDRVILYALSPESKFSGIVEITGECSRSSDMPFEPAKKGEIWEYRREVRSVVMPPADNWVEAKTLLEDLALLEDARKAGKTLSRSFAAKLRDVPQLSTDDHDRIARALGA